jgi:hypothetical protein
VAGPLQRAECVRADVARPARDQQVRHPLPFPHPDVPMVL